MRGISVLIYSIKQGFKSMKKNRLFTIASIGTMAACLFLFGMFYFIVSNFQYMIKEMETSVGLTVFFIERISEEQIADIGEAIKTQPEVDHIDYVSAEEAWEQFKKDNFSDNPELTESFGQENPLEDSASYQVYLKDIASQDKVAKYIETVEGVRVVKRSDDTAKNLESVNRLVSYVSIAIIVILMAVSIFLINSTISTGITVRRTEIGIMRLMGASDFFIRAPFIVEGVVIGAVGACIPLVVLVFSYRSMVSYINSKFNVISNWISFLDTVSIFRVLIPMCLLIGIGVGFLGSFITVRKHLNI